MAGPTDLVAGVKRMVAAMDHANKAGEPRVRPQCTRPPTGRACCAGLIMTGPAVLAVNKRAAGLSLLEPAPGVSPEEVRARTGVPFADDASPERAA